MQSICAGDGKLISKVCKTIQIFPKTLKFCTETTSIPNFLNFDRLAHIVPQPCYNILLFMLIGLTKLKFLWAGEAVARWGTLLLKTFPVSIGFNVNFDPVNPNCT